MDDARASLEPRDLDEARDVVTGLVHPERDVRTRTLALALVNVTTELEAARIA